MGGCWRVPRSGWTGCLAAIGLAMLLLVLVVAGGHARNERLASASQPHTMQQMDAATARVPAAPELDPEEWNVSASSSVPGHEASAVLDSSPSTYWRSRPGRTATITLDMIDDETLTGLAYTPRVGVRGVGAIQRFEISVSADGSHFGAPIASGTWADNSEKKTVDFSTVHARAVRLTAIARRGTEGFDASTIRLMGAFSPAVLTASPLAPAPANPATAGLWGASIGFPLVPVAAALLPHDQLLVWAADGNYGTTQPRNASWRTQTAVLNLDTGVVTPLTVSNTRHNMFCPGIAILPDGRILVAGGESDRQTSIYDPSTNTWSSGPAMNLPRGYNGTTPLSDGQVLTIGGSWAEPGIPKTAEVWSSTGGWRELTGVPATAIRMSNDNQDDGYAWLFPVSGGRLLQAGPSQQMHWITTTGAGSITSAGPRGADTDEHYGNATYFDVDKILVTGGARVHALGAAASNEANVIDVSGATPKVVPTGAMASRRLYSTSVVLPSGQVLVVGGTQSWVGFGNQGSVLTPELWDPSTGTFTTMAPMATPRDYHSTAVLLPDGRVFAGGGGLCGGVTGCNTNHPDGQIFSPPYLFNADGAAATRPSIVSAPGAATNGGTIDVTTDRPVTSFSIVRYGEATHSTDNDQRRIPLDIVASSGTSYRLRIPADPGVALPGPYMLFAMTAQGTPSVSTTVMVSAPPAAQGATSYQRAVMADQPAAYWPLAGSTSDPVGTDISGNGDSLVPIGSVVPRSASTPAPTSTAGVALDGLSGQLDATQGTTNPTTYSEELWFSTTTTRGGYLMGFHQSPTGAIQGYQDRELFMDDSGQLVDDVASSIGHDVIITSPRSYNDGVWHHAVATEGRDGMHLYIDGQLAGSNPTVAGASYYGYWRVGAGYLLPKTKSASSNQFAGSVSDVAVYGRELDAAQVIGHERAATTG